MPAIQILRRVRDGPRLISSSHPFDGRKEVKNGRAPYRQHTAWLTIAAKMHDNLTSMVNRLQKLSQNNSLFLFGARGCGKSTLLKSLFNQEPLIWIDLLGADEEERFRSDPDELSYMMERVRPKTVVIDEIQKVPKLLDIVHREIEKNPNVQFVLTGSSARKLRRNAANLLAGRAFDYLLFPFTFLELGERFDLNQALRFGSLPKLLQYNNDNDKIEYLRSYARTYLREEILQEQLIREVDPFRDFLEVAAQSSGKILNFSKLSRDLGVDDQTIKNYFSILIDTYAGFTYLRFIAPYVRGSVPLRSSIFLILA